MTAPVATMVWPGDRFRIPFGGIQVDVEVLDVSRTGDVVFRRFGLLHGPRGPVDAADYRFQMPERRFVRLATLPAGNDARTGAAG